MKYTRLLLSICIVLLCGGTFAHADELKEYTNEKSGFSLKYPAAWYNAGFGDLTLYSSEDIENEGTGGAAITITVSPLRISDFKKEGDLLKRLIKEANGDIAYVAGKKRLFAGKEWHTAAFEYDRIKTGQAFCTVHRQNAYLIMIGYTDDENEKRYEPDMAVILESFRFKEILYKRLEDAGLGISFEYPEHWIIQNQSGTGYLLMSMQGAYELYAYAGLGIVIVPKNKSEKSVAEMIDEIVTSKSAENVIGPENRQIAGLTWTYIEAENYGNKSIVAIRESGDNIVVILCVINPPEYEPEIEDVIKTFFGSLQFIKQKG